MISLIEDNHQYGYRIFHSDVIENFQNELIFTLNQSHSVLMKRYSNINSNATWLYSYYNIFSLVGQSKHFYDLYKDLNQLIRYNLPNQPYLWFQSWMNIHNVDEVLDWHNHHWDFHGYMSIDPKKTKTIFRNYQIENKVGYIYFAPGNREHKVEVLEPYDGKRITLGFDVSVKEYQPNGLISLIPVL